MKLLILTFKEQIKIIRKWKEKEMITFKAAYKLILDENGEEFQLWRLKELYRMLPQDQWLQRREKNREK